MSKKIPTNLNSDEMLSCLEIFSMYYKYEKEKHSEIDKVHISDFEQKLISNPPCYWFRPDYIKEISSHVLTNIIIKDFVFQLVFKFFSSGGNGENFATRLAMNLAEGLAVDGPDVSKSMLPTGVSEILPANIFNANDAFVEKLFSVYRRLFGKQETLVSFLVNNKHFTVLVLINLSADLISSNVQKESPQ